MSDLDTMKEIYSRAGVVFKIQPGDEAGHSALVITAKAGPKNVGYRGFVTIMDFDSDGMLVEVGVWE